MIKGVGGRNATRVRTGSCSDIRHAQKCLAMPRASPELGRRAKGKFQREASLMLGVAGDGSSRRSALIHELDYRDPISRQSLSRHSS